MKCAGYFVVSLARYKAYWLSYSPVQVINNDHWNVFDMFEKFRKKSPSFLEYLNDKN